MLPRRECWKTKEPYQKKMAIYCGNTGAGRNISQLLAAEDVASKEEERERMNKEAKEEESKMGKERWREGQKGSRSPVPFLRWEGVGNSLDLSVCVLVVSPFVLVVTVPFSNVNVVCEVVYFDSDCEFVEPQTFSLSRKRQASVALEGETETNIEGPPVKAVRESARRRPMPQGSLFEAVPEGMQSRAPSQLEGTPSQQTATRGKRHGGGRRCIGPGV